MRIFFSALLWLGVACASFWGQASPGPAHAQAVLGGIVVKDPGDEPLKKALIELIAESQSAGANYTAVTGVDGSFHIENILPGRYRMFVERTGYQEMDRRHRRSEGRVLEFAAGQELNDLVIHLQAAAVVEGRVTDEDGDPMPEAQVAVLRQTFVAGHSHWEQAGAERSNDLGEYRIAGLPAGSYFVSVTPPPDFRSLIETSGNAASDAGRRPATSDKPAAVSYQTTYYPGTRDRSQAASIQLRPGDDFPANFSLAPAPSLTIRGAVVNLLPGSTAAILLQSRDFNLVLSGAEMHKDGTFEIRDVSPGAYTIVATVDNAPVPMMARQSLQVASNVDGLRLAPQSGGTIHGRLRLDPANVNRSKADRSQIFLSLRSADGDDDLSSLSVDGGSSSLAQVNADGSFAWKDVPAGRYFIQISDSTAMPDLFLKSVSAGGSNVIDSGFTVGGDNAVIDIVASLSGAVVQGVATNQKNESVPDALVVAIPEATFHNHPERYRIATADQRGHYALRELAPGNYTLFAWENMDGDAYYDPEFVRQHESQGKAVHVNEGDRASVELKTIPAAEDPTADQR